MTSTLQWRAGQLPGQTRPRLSPRPRRHRPSMEGRAIARPNQKLMNETLRVEMPSMEGRAIARPNSTPSPPPPSRPPTFNGGPGNCPAKRHTRHR